MGATMHFHTIAPCKEERQLACPIRHAHADLSTTPFHTAADDTPRLPLRIVVCLPVDNDDMPRLPL